MGRNSVVQKTTALNATDRTANQELVPMSAGAAGGEATLPGDDACAFDMNDSLKLKIGAPVAAGRLGGLDGRACRGASINDRDASARKKGALHPNTDDPGIRNRRSARRRLQ